MSHPLRNNPDVPTTIFGRMWQNALDRILPMKMKRTFFLVCVFAFVYQIETATHEVVKKLNSILHLTRDDDVIEFPILVRKSMWKSLELPIELDDGTVITDVKSAVSTKNPKLVDQIIESLIDRSPKWIIYGPRKQIENDLRVMFENFAV